jgi:hypothetical protein
MECINTFLSMEGPLGHGINDWGVGTDILSETIRLIYHLVVLEIINGTQHHESASNTEIPIKVHGRKF